MKFMTDPYLRSNSPREILPELGGRTFRRGCRDSVATVISQSPIDSRAYWSWWWRSQNEKLTKIGATSTFDDSGCLQDLAFPRPKLGQASGVRRRTTWHVPKEGRMTWRVFQSESACPYEEDSNSGCASRNALPD